METTGKWYKKKRPNLQIDILEMLAIHGNLTKAGTEKKLKKRHESILDSFNRLEDIKFIEKTKHGAFEPGRKHNLYQITEMGLKALIDEYSRNSWKFWNIFTGYCIHQDKELGIEKVNKFINLAKEKVFTYKYQGYKFQLNSFDQTLEMCLESFIHNVNGINYGQIILEILSTKRGLTCRQLVDETTFSEIEISKILSLYTLEDYDTLNHNRVYTSPNIPIPIPSDVSIDMPFYIEEQLRKKYSDFFLHCLIIPSKSDEDGGEKKYDLSLYGVMVVLAIIRYHDIGKLKYGLFHKEMTFPDYLYKIAKNYQDKLPLIFGKWKELKKVLRLFTEYNFDIIISKEFRQRAFNTMSIAEGGNKELLYGIEQIALQNDNGLSNFVFAGEISLRNYFDRWYEPDDNISILRKILDELTIAIHPIESAFNEFSAVQYEIDKDISRRYLKEIVVPKYEKMLEWEISSIYYFNLYSDVGFSKKLNYPMSYFSTSQDKKLLIPIDTNPKDCLNSIFEMDKRNPVISTWFYEVIGDLHLYIKAMDENMRSFLAEKLDSYGF